MQSLLARFRPKTCAEDFVNPAWNFPVHWTLLHPLASAAHHCTATEAPMAHCLIDPQSPFEPMTEPMTDQEEPVMTLPL